MMWRKGLPAAQTVPRSQCHLHNTVSSACQSHHATRVGAAGRGSRICSRSLLHNPQHLYRAFHFSSRQMEENNLHCLLIKSWHPLAACSLFPWGSWDWGEAFLYFLGDREPNKGAKSQGTWRKTCSYKSALVPWGQCKASGSGIW